MSLYECANCGTDECFFPQVLLAINTEDTTFPYHENLWEVKASELSREFPREDVNGFWDRFFTWLGNIGMTTKENNEHGLKWFCSIKCAENYLKLKYNNLSSWDESEEGD